MPWTIASSSALKIIGDTSSVDLARWSEKASDAQDFEPWHSVYQCNDEIRYGKRPCEAEERFNKLYGNLSPMPVEDSSSGDERGSIVKCHVFLGEAAREDCPQEASDAAERARSTGIHKNRYFDKELTEWLYE